VETVHPCKPFSKPVFDQTLGWLLTLGWSDGETLALGWLLTLGWSDGETLALGVTLG